MRKVNHRDGNRCIRWWGGVLSLDRFQSYSVQNYITIKKTYPTLFRWNTEYIYQYKRYKVNRNVELLYWGQGELNRIMIEDIFPYHFIKITYKLSDTLRIKSDIGTEVFILDFWSLKRIWSDFNLPISATRWRHYLCEVLFRYFHRCFICCKV